MNAILTEVFQVTTLAVILTKTAPLLLAAIGGAFTQKGGILNIGLEGMMLMSAFGAISIGAAAHSVLVGVLGAMGYALVLALLFAVATLWFKADFIVVGIGINLLAAGLTVLMLTVLYKSPGVTPGDVKAFLPKIPLGVVGDIPIIGPMLNEQTPLVWLAFILVPVYSYVLYHTPYGVHLRAVGEDESAAQAAGINVIRVKFISILLSGAFCGLAGAQLSMSTVGSFTAGMTAGRGFIAVAALTFGLGRPYFTMIACLIFGAADALADRLSLAGVPSNLALTTPYIITVIAITLAALRVRSAFKARARKALAVAGV